MGTWNRLFGISGFLRAGVLSILALGAISQRSSHAQEMHKHDHVHGSSGAKICADTSLSCASTVTPAFAADGTLWIAWVASGQVSVARSTDHGRTFSTPVAVHPGKLQLDNGPDERPKIVVDAKGRITVAYATRDEAYNGQVFVARSVDGGASFSPPVRLTNDPASQRFEALALDADGKVFAAWLDKRNGAAAKRNGQKYSGAALAYAWAGQDSATFADAAIARDNTCECCRIGVAFAGPGKPVVLFRNVFDGGIRDHGVITFAAPNAPGPVQRVSFDDWVTEACPHHGPSLAVAADGSYHATWFAMGRAQRGVYYARSRDGGATFGKAMPLGKPARQISRPFVLAGRQALHLAWKEFDGEQTVVALMSSRDLGATWTSPREIARTRDASDHPMLISDGAQDYLSWQTKTDGYRLQSLEMVP